MTNLKSLATTPSPSLSLSLPPSLCLSVSFFLPSPLVSDWECCICDAVVVSEDGTEGDTGTLIEKEQSHSLTPSNVIRQTAQRGPLRPPAHKNESDTHNT